ncbi:ANK-REP-REGION domain-containing protein [Mycena chlorophos]|uniref:ANK-REP-REGION domain-containing protein n=1 Tax=Mycena chlorophos TaxID=658473 RepID=A0A8H6SSL6_MYCCL|nr:ANK-REP-REGION domain-containing protein [Mycena chlorophos]
MVLQTSPADMALYGETVSFGPIYGGTGGSGGVGGEQGGQGGTGQGNTFTVNAQTAIWNHIGAVVQDPERNRIFELFSPLNFYPRHQTIAQTRVPNTGNWLLVHPMFKQWKVTQGALLWCQGDAGVGKTILAYDYLS